MSSGSRNIGSSYSPFWFSKVWSGGTDRKRREFTPYSCQIWKIYQVPAYYPNWFYPYVPPVYVLWAANLPVYRAVPYDGNADIAALAKVASLVRGHDFNAGIFLAESPESLRLVVGSVKACFNLLNAVKRLDYGSIMRAIPSIVKGTAAQKGRVAKAVRKRDVGETWLAVQYGWAPLANDLSEAIDAINAWKNKYSKARVKAVKNSVGIIDLRADGSTKSQNCPYVTRFSYTVELRERLTTWHTLGLNNLASVIWEKIPFSFVADWFIPIGTYLDVRGTLAGVDLVACKVTHTCISVDNPTKVDPASYPGVVQGRYTGSYVTMTRDIWLDFSNYCPTPSFKALSKALSKGHLQNASALISGFIAGHKSLPEARKAPQTGLSIF